MIVKDINTFLKHVPANTSFSWELIKPFILQAENTYVLPLLGATFYADLSAIGAPTGKALELITRLEHAISNIAFWMYLPVGNVQISDSGVQIITTGDRKTAFEWQLNQVMASVSNLGMNGLDSTIDYLETNAADFNTYKTSDTRTANTTYFINNAPQFDDCYHINRSRLTFACFWPIIKQVEDEQITAAMGGEYTALKTRLASTDPVSAADKKLLKVVRNAIAYATIAKALPQLAVEISPLGLSANYLSMINNVNYKTPASDYRVQLLLSHVKETAAGYFSEIPLLLPGYTPADDGGQLPTDLKFFPFF
ncbi:MAG: DUF6712 family protein [Daejeonella sp.]